MKTALVLFLFCFSTTAVVAQEADSTWVANVISRVDSLFETGNLTACKAVVNDALDTLSNRGNDISAGAELLLYVLVNVEKGLGDFPAAERSILKRLDVARQVYGPENLNVAESMGQLAYIRFKLGKLETVDTLFNNAQTMMQRLGMTNTNQYNTNCSNYAAYYQTQGYYLKAEQLHLEALHTYKQIVGWEERYYGAKLNNLAVFYSFVQRSNEAVQRYEEAEAIWNKYVPKQHPYSLRLLQNKGRTLLDAGRYREAEAVLNDALATARASMSPEDPQLPSFLRGLSLLYGKTGRYKEAQVLEEEALLKYKNAYGVAHPEYILGLLNLAGLYRNQDARTADTLLRQAILIQEQENRTRSTQYAQALTQLGTLYQMEGKNAAARPLIEKGARLGSEIMGTAHPGYYAMFGEALVRQYLLENRPDSALVLLDQMRDTLLSTYGERHERYISLQTQYGQVWESKGNAEWALAYFQSAFEALQRNLSDNFSFLSTDEREKFARSFEQYRSASLVIARVFPNNQQVCAFQYDMALFQKELLASYDYQLLRGWQQHPDSTYRAYLTLRSMIARQWSLPAKERHDLPELEAQRIILEKQLATQAAPEAMPGGIQPMRWRQVQQVLREDEVAIEWLMLPAKPGSGDGPCYAALLLRSGKEAPDLVLLPATEQINALFASKGSRGLQYATRTYAGDNLYNSLWRPVEPFLRGARRIYYAPTGPLHLLNFDAMQVPGGRLLSEKYQLVRVVNTGRLLDAGFGQSVAGVDRALLSGGLDYESVLPSEALKESASPSATSSLWRGASPVGEWTTLPNTLLEVQYLDTLMRKKKRNTTLLTGSAGSETAVKSLVATQAPQLLHFATHGFFFEKNTAAPGSLGLVAAENPMFRSGLVLAGANPAWRGEPNADLPDDGILTADEISLMPLQNTVLVVLSACETGLGDVRDDEGVYGLQRAFRLAGARNIVMSLWRVPDEQTRLFMHKFYTALFEKGDMHEAFQRARLDMRRQYSNPFYWAGFVLLK